MNPSRMTPIELLMSEHRVIESVLDCLEIMADRATSADGRLDPADARAVIDFLRQFADACHHGKEEKILFEAMEERGVPTEHGPTAQMRHEHEEGRRLVEGMEGAVIDVERGDDAARSAFAAHARRFVEMLRLHIRKEDDCLFPMAGEILDEPAMRSVADRFAGAGDGDARTQRFYRELAADLSARYRAASEPASERGARAPHGGTEFG